MILYKLDFITRRVRMTENILKKPLSPPPLSPSVYSHIYSKACIKVFYQSIAMYLKCYHFSDGDVYKRKTLSR